MLDTNYLANIAFLNIIFQFIFYMLCIMQVQMNNWLLDYFIIIKFLFSSAACYNKTNFYIFFSD